MQHHALISAQFRRAIHQANLTVRLGLLAIACFCVFGTLASLAAFKDSAWVYYAFHYPKPKVNLFLRTEFFHLI